MIKAYIDSFLTEIRNYPAQEVIQSLLGLLATEPLSREIPELQSMEGQNPALGQILNQHLEEIVQQYEWSKEDFIRRLIRYLVDESPLSRDCRSFPTPRGINRLVMEILQLEPSHRFFGYWFRQWR